MPDLLSELCIFFNELADNRIQPAMGFPVDAAHRLAQYYLILRDKKEENFVGLEIAFREFISEFGLPLPINFLDLLREAELITSPRDLRKEKQRDHYVHTLHAFSLGVYLFHRAERLQDMLLPENRSLDWSQWAFCALLHDIGYIAENAGTKQIIVLNRFWDLIFQPTSILSFVSNNSDVPPSIELELSHFRKDVYGRLSQNFGLVRATDKSAGTDLFEEYVSIPIDTFEGGDHGVKSHFILQLCQCICEEFMVYFENHEGNVRDYLYPRTNPWHRFSNAMQAIQAHCKPANLIHGHYMLNPWINALHLVDELQDYNRPFLSPSYRTNTARPLRIDDIDISVANSILYFHYPSSNAVRINDALGTITTDSGICVQAK